MERESFIFYKSFYDAIKEVDLETQAKVYNAIFEYEFYNIEVKLDGIEKALFTLIKPQLEANNKRYENGKKGGRPITKEEPNHNLTITKGKPNKNVNVNDNVNVNNNVNENKNKVLEQFLNKFWKSYPKKLGKGNVEKWFIKNNPSKELADKMVLQVERYKDTKSWKEKDGQFIPYPTSWLNGKMWEDEFETETEEEERIMNDGI